MSDDDESRKMASPKLPLQQPSLPWRAASSFTMLTVAALSKGFMYGLNSVEVSGLQGFLSILDARKDVGKRQRGLITGLHTFTHRLVSLSADTVLISLQSCLRVSSRSIKFKCAYDSHHPNRLSYSLDDPLMWGVLPLRYVWDPANFRWGLGAHDICFKNA
jgi:monolysocardiolipin acyltransferase